MDLREQLQATLSGSYTLERELGGGGMSRVFVADETRLKRKVVVKVLSPELAQGISVERFEREIQTVAGLQHAHIVPVHTTGDTGGLPYYTMPYVDGESLRGRLAQGPMRVSDVVPILRDVARALSYAHERGVVHRDIKPDNVLLSGGAAVVTDFGIAKAISASRAEPTGATLTQVGTSIGTPAYMAPEQAAGDPTIDHRADIYAFGAMAYEMLAGRVLFPDRTAPRMLAAHMGEPPVPITSVRGDVPAPLAQLVMQCLAKEPADRPQSASAIVSALDAVTSGGSMPALSPLMLGGRTSLVKALMLWGAATLAVYILTKAAMVGIGLPDWALPGSMGVMALGLPVILWTAYVQRVAHRAMTKTPTLTPGGTIAPVVQGTMATMALKAAPRMSWQRTARGGMMAFGAFVVVIAAFLVMRAYGIGPAATLFSKGALAVEDRIILTDFAVANGDTSLAKVVSFAVRGALAQSKALTIIDEAQVASTLELMTLPRRTRVDTAVGRQVALREGAKALLDGLVTPVGTGYVLSLRLMTADSGRVLATVQATGDGPKGLLEAADRAARELRTKAGESLRSVQASLPLLRAQTASLEALRFYSQAFYVNGVERNSAKAVELDRRAVQIDSEFAPAWLHLGIAASNAGFPQSLVDSAITRGWQLRDRLSERSRRSAEANYAAYVLRDRRLSVPAYQASVAAGNRTNLNELAVQYRGLRRYTEAESTYRLAVAEFPAATIFALGLHRLLIDAGRIEVADSMARELVRQNPTNSAARWALISQSYVHRDYDAVSRQVDSATRVPDASDRAWPFLYASQVAVMRGNRSKAASFMRDRMRADSSMGRTPSLLSAATTRATVAAILLGRAEAERTELESALAAVDLAKIPFANRPDAGIATTLAMTGNPAKARALLAGLTRDARSDRDRRVIRTAVATAEAYVALAERRPLDALNFFRAADVADDGPTTECSICADYGYALAFDQAGQVDSAVTHFERFVGGSFYLGWGFQGARLAPSHERLGQLYEQKGNAAKAAEHYRAFIDLWKNADPELQPRVAEARRRLAKLAPVEGKR